MAKAEDRHSPARRVAGGVRQGWLISLMVFGAPELGCKFAVQSDSQRGASSSQPGGATSSDDGGAAVLSFGAFDASGQPLDVAVSPPPLSLCKGQCVDLTAMASGGVAPYEYRWDQGLPPEMGPHHVCPTRTTTYAVVVTDSSGSQGEFSRAPAEATASTTVFVVPSCSGDSTSGPDGAVLPSPSSSPVTSAPLPSGGLKSLCGDSWPSQPIGIHGPTVRSGDSSVAIDGAGNIVVAASFKQSINIDGQLIPVTGLTDAIVIKLDPQCRVLWSKRFGANQASVYTTAVAADSSSNVIVGGYFETANPPQNPLDLVDFGTGGYAPNAVASAFVVKLDSNASTTWAKVFTPASLGDGTATLEDLASDAEGNVFFAVNSSAPLDFGAAMTTDAGTGDAYVAKLDQSGGLVFANSSQMLARSSWPIDSVSPAGDGSLWIAGTSGRAAFVNGVPGSTSIVAMHLDSRGLPIWSQTLSPPTPIPWDGAAVRAGPSGDALLSAAWQAGTSGLGWTRWIEALSPSGAARWTMPSLASYGSAWDPAGLARPDSAGHIWVAGEFIGSLALGPPAGTLVSVPGGTSVEVAAFDTAGNALSGSVWSGANSPSIGDMALDQSGHVVLVGWDSSSSLFVTALGF